MLPMVARPLLRRRRPRLRRRRDGRMIENVRLLILLRLISWPYMRRHRVRTVLTIAAISIGVGVFVAMRSANASMLSSFEETINRIAGATELQITAGELGFDEDVLERVQALPEVRVAAPIIESVVGTNLPGQGNLLVLGVDMTGDRGLREYDLAEGDEPILDDPLVFLAQPDSIMVSDAFARRNGLRLKSALPLETAGGPKTFIIRGILRPSGLSSAFGGNLAIMDVYAAQYVFGRGRRFGRIDLAVTKGARISDVQARLQSMLGPGFEVQPPASRGQSFESVLRIYRFMLVFSSAFALLVGMFIIYNAFAIAVAQRRGEIGLLRALGASGRQVWGLFLLESLVFGSIGSVAGIVLGQLGAGTMTRGATRLVQGVYGVGGSDPEVTLTGTIIALAIGAGLVTSAVAALVPARAAARVDPVQALQKGKRETPTGHVDRRTLVVALIAGGAGAVLLAGSETLPPFYAGFALVLAAFLLMTPALTTALTRAIRPLLCWLRPVEGALAADSLIAAPTRTAATVMALMLSLALAIALAGGARGSYAAINEWVDNSLNPDLFVTTGATLTDRNYSFPSSLQAELEAIDGVAEVQSVRSARIQMDGEPVMLTVIEMDKTVRRSRRHAVAGDVEEMFRLAGAGQGVIGSENFATLRHLRLNDIVNLPGPKGVVALPLVGIIRDYADQQGSLFIERKLFLQHWPDETVDIFRIFVEPTIAASDVKTAILERFRNNRRIFVLENAEVRRYVSDLTDQWFSMSYVQLAVAVVVAILGIVNSMTVSVTDRRRELGILRAVGGFREQVRWAIWMEAIAVALVSLIIGLAFGAVQLYCQLEMTARDFPGLRFDYMYPVGVALALVPIIIVTAVVGAVAPAEAAVRGSLVEALEYE
jgi:putative ABC transport system permease protein